MEKKTKKTDLVDKFILMYPQLKKDKKKIINYLFNDKKEEQTKEHVLEKFYHKDNCYYRDKIGLIRDSQMELVGVYDVLNGQYNYFFFDDLKKYKVLEDIKFD
ncbi:hypothetical protein Catovirus_2_200 [Catovirus CTV1]|uniref:Uncharacterized protein n=1 Tax=Catovirus CTV1 TaxID=1977631 RepID=A0A1V0SC45_9VIRU|nr:hypothetical protein Catovirus_2_200 [Catovirus CTV1]